MTTLSTSAGCSSHMAMTLKIWETFAHSTSPRPQSSVWSRREIWVRIKGWVYFRFCAFGDRMWRTWPGGQLNRCATTLKEGLELLPGPWILGCTRWRNDMMKLSSELAQDRRAWNASNPDVVNFTSEALAHFVRVAPQKHVNKNGSGEHPMRLFRWFSYWFLIHHCWAVTIWGARLFHIFVTLWL